MTSIRDTPYLQRRPRRNRKSPAIRSLVNETVLVPSDFVVPLFLTEGTSWQEEVPSMPGIYRYSVDLAVREAVDLYKLGIRSVDLFQVVAPELKNPEATEALNPENLVCSAVRAIKREIPEMCVMVDIALDPYTNHGHDGIVDEEGAILNDHTLQVLGKMSLLAAEAGADLIAPSDMMDGRVGYLRNSLDGAGFLDVGIVSYAAKFASAFYGPFRDALGSAPQFGDKKTYQLNPGNRREALLECALDAAEGADMLLVKPALAYLDVIAEAKKQTYLPVGAYHVSGEYAMVMAAAEKGWLNGDQVLSESLLSIKRAGADFIFTYAAKRLLKSGRLDFRE